MIRFVHSLAEDDQELLQIQASNSWYNLDRVSTYLHNIKVCIKITDHQMELVLQILNC